MSDFPFSIPRTVVAQSFPFSYKQTTATATINVKKYEGPDAGDEEKITELSGLLITPALESQKVILQLHLFGEWAINPSHGSVSFKRIVGGVETWLDPRATSGNRRPCNALFALTKDNNDNSTPESLNTTFVDEPNTTKEVTYEVYLLHGGVATTAPSANYYLNRGVLDSNGEGHERGTSTFSAKCEG